MKKTIKNILKVDNYDARCQSGLMLQPMEVQEPLVSDTSEDDVRDQLGRFAKMIMPLENLAWEMQNKIKQRRFANFEIYIYILYIWLNETLKTMSKKQICRSLVHKI